MGDAEGRRVRRAVRITLGGAVDCREVSANFERLVLGCIEADFLQNIQLSGLFEIYKFCTPLHSTKVKNTGKLCQIVWQFCS